MFFFQCYLIHPTFVKHFFVFPSNISRTPGQHQGHKSLHGDVFGSFHLGIGSVSVASEPQRSHKQQLNQKVPQAAKTIEKLIKQPKDWTKVSYNVIIGELLMNLDGS